MQHAPQGLLHRPLEPHRQYPLHTQRRTPPPNCLAPRPRPLPIARSVLLKDSFTDSFPPRDRPFMRAFAETQMFAVYCDAVIDNPGAR